jgi:hypothetical protein
MTTYNENKNVDTSVQPPSDWRLRYSHILNEMWNERIAGAICLCAICNTCGGGSISTCECRRKEFMQNVLYDELLKYCSLKRISLGSPDELREYEFRKIVSEGKFYCPSGKHYGNNTSNVRCDRCNKHHLHCCVGFGTMDLCMSCVEIVATHL